MKRISHRLVRLIRQKPWIAYCLSFAVLGGVIFLVSSSAATLTASLQPEAGNRSANVVTMSDSTASGGEHVMFAPGTPGSPGTFTESFNDLSHWTLGSWTTGWPGASNPQTKATIVNGRAYIENFDQNYGDATLRSDRLYDVRNGGTFSFDVSLEDGALPATGAFIGDPDVAFIDQPLNAPSYYDDNGKGTGPRNGGYYQFFHTCKLPWQAGHARQFINWAETVMPGEESCAGQVTIAAGQLNRVELRYDGNNGWELWVSNAGTTSPLTRLRSFTMQIPEIGYFLLGSHNHASMKYSSDTLRSANATFDNVSYPAANRTSASFRNGQNVTKGTADTAHVVFNACAATGVTSGTMKLNGQSYPFNPVFIPIDPHSHCYPHAIEVPVSAVRDGANTITVENMSNPSNIDLVLTRNTP